MLQFAASGDERDLQPGSPGGPRMSPSVRRRALLLAAGVATFAGCGQEVRTAAVLTTDAAVAADGAGPGRDAQPAPDAQPAAVADRPLRTQRGCASGGAGRVLFEIPRAGEVSDDFFRLPFPSDLRVRDGRVDLGELPRPGATPLAPDLVDRTLTAIEGERIGFSLHPTVFFRVSRALGVGDAALAALARAVTFVDVTPGAPERGQAVPFVVGWPAVGRYLCGPSLAVSARGPEPLLPGHSYAVVLRGLLDAAGAPLGADADLAAVLGGEPVAGDERGVAWQRHAPLRAWLAEQAIPAGTVVGAALFTTQSIDTLAELRRAVAAAPAPALRELVRCGEGRASSCDDPRVPPCAGLAPDTDGRFVEYRGRLEIPVFQRGTPPFENEGGGIALEDDGRATPVRREAICVSLAVPRGQAPAGGWPLVVYSHGTGGDFRNHIDAGLAGELAAGDLGGGAATPMATLGYDGVLHGSRKGTSARSTEDLVYNVFNPTAARDNSLQAAADLFAVARGLAVVAAAGVPLSVDRPALYGHSQGGNAAALAAGYEPRFGMIVLSGTGGGLAVSMLEKRKPFPVGALLPVLLGESIAVDARHPVLSLVQMYFDRADPLNHARRIVVAPGSGMPPRHLLHVYGGDDSYAPEVTQAAFGAAAGLPVLNPLAAAALVAGAAGPVVVEAPVAGNLVVGATRVTAVQAQYRPRGYDGHFVATQNPDARAAVQRTLGTYFRDGAPEVR
jgi:hypothetical protein